MIRRPPRSPLTDPLFPDTTLLRSRAVLVRDPEGLGKHLGREARGQVTVRTRDPVPHQLHPALTALRLDGDLGSKVGGLHLGCVVADVALCAGDVPAGADQPRQVLALVDPAGVGGRAARSEEHPSELQSLMRISYAVFCLKKKNNKKHM